LVFKVVLKLFIHLSCENLQTKSITSKELFKRSLFSQPSLKKDLQKFIKIPP
jgi:hypothetical protein